MSRRSYQKKRRGRKSQTRRGGQREEKLPNVDVQLPLCREELVAMM
jgi:hypothetical protein